MLIFGGFKLRNLKLLKNLNLDFNGAVISFNGQYRNFNELLTLGHFGKNSLSN